jgi:hypothetical protein
LSVRRAATLLVIVAVAVGAASSCAARRRLPGKQASQLAGLYQARIEPAQGPVRSFRVLLFAGPPDRLHGELISPIGTTQLVVDGGGGRLAVALVRKRVAYVGPSNPAVIERIVGLALGLDELVDMLLVGRPVPPGYEVERSGEPPGVLPSRLELRSGDSRLTLVRRRTLALPADDADLGRGEPPAGLELRPLEELDLEHEPELSAEDARGGEGHAP